MAAGIHVGDHHALRLAYVGPLDGLLEPVASRSHIRRVERARDLQCGYPLGPSGLGLLAGRRHAVWRAGDYHLSRGVVVGHPDVVVDRGTGLFNSGVVQAQYGGHGSHRVLSRYLHGLAAFHHEGNGVGEVQRARGSEGAVLAQAVPGMAGGVDAQALDGVQDHHAGHKGGQLGVTRLA